MSESIERLRNEIDEKRAELSKLEARTKELRQELQVLIENYNARIIARAKARV